MHPQSQDAPSSEPVAAFFQKHRTGLVALVFTDLVDSTALLSQLGDQAGASFLRKRREIIRSTLRTLPESEEIETAGDSFLLAFSKPSDAARFALLTQAALRSFSTDSGLPVQERIGIHLGEVVIAEGETEGKAKDLYGIQLATASRVMSLAQGGQILLTRGAFDSARQVLKGEDLPGVGPLSWVNHGPYLLKGVDEPVEVCEVGEAESRNLKAPKTSEKAQRQVRADEEPVLGWRPAVAQEVPNTPWVLEEKLGEGGFGEVWVAQHPRLRERRVFKFCFRADRVRSLKRELTLFRVLKEHIGEHANIVRLYDVYLEEPPYYLEEEFVQGKDLATWCREHGGVEAISQETKLEIAAQVADALQAAHDSGVIHRDVKPGNILVAGHTSEPKSVSVKLTDFGIGQVTSVASLKGVTQTGFTETILAGSTSSKTGTSLYLAPELLAGHPASTRSDIYSLGVVLYQLLMGDLSRPLTTDWTKGIQDPLLEDDLGHCFVGDAQERFAAANLLAKGLRALPERRAQVARQKAAEVERDRLSRQAAKRKRAVIASGCTAGVFLLVAMAFGYGMREARQARQVQRHYSYAADMKAAQVALQQNNRGLAVGLLRRYLPRQGEQDLRGVEWRYLWQKSRSDELLSFPHPAKVIRATWSSDGRHLATVATDQKIRIWDIGSTTQLHEFETSNEIGFRSVSSSPDGKWLAIPSSPGADIRETSGWTVVKHLDCPLRLMAFSPDCRFLATTGRGELRVWNLTDWSYRSLTDVYPDFGNLAFAPDGNQIAYCSANFGERHEKIHLWNFKADSQNSFGGEYFTTSLAISPDGHWLAAGSAEGEVQVWNLRTLHLKETFRAHRGLVYALDFSPDCGRLATGGNDQMIQLWEVGTWNNLRTLRGHSYEIWSLEFSANGEQLVSSSADGTVKVWDTDPHSLKSDRFTLRANSRVVGVEPSSDVLVAEDAATETTDLWSLSEGHLKESFLWSDLAPGGCVEYRTFPNRNLIVGIERSGTAHFWKLTTRAHVRAIQVAEANFSLAGVSSDNRWLMGKTRTGVMLYDLEAPLSAKFFPAMCFTLLPDGMSLVCASTNDTVELWDVRHHAIAATLGGHDWWIEYLQASPDGKLVASGSTDGTLGLWSVESRQPLHARLRGHQSSVVTIAFSSDGKTVVSGGNDGTIRWWNVATGQEMLLFEDVTMIPRGQDAYDAVWDSGGRVLAWQERDGSIRTTLLPALAEIDAGTLGPKSNDSTLQ